MTSSPVPGTQLAGWHLYKRASRQPDRVLASRQRAKAQRLAYSELARRHPDEYRELYLLRKARLADAGSSAVSS